MDIKQIQELVKLINKTNIGEITIEEEGVKITVKQKKEPAQTIIAGTAAPAYSPAPVAAALLLLRRWLPNLLPNLKQITW
jgi:acetyl-CoA carboxylase biotin carboxyl carrier protein